MNNDIYRRRRSKLQKCIDFMLLGNECFGTTHNFPPPELKDTDSGEYK